MNQLHGRVIKAGKTEGQVLYSPEPIGFFGHVHPETGAIREQNHPLMGQSITGKILVFPYAKGSTVGSYIIYALKRLNTAPAALILAECEVIIAVGAIIAEIPTIDKVDISQLEHAAYAWIDHEVIRFE